MNYKFNKHQTRPINSNGYWCHSKITIVSECSIVLNSSVFSGRFAPLGTPLWPPYPLDLPATTGKNHYDRELSYGH